MCLDKLINLGYFVKAMKLVNFANLCRVWHYLELLKHSWKLKINASENKHAYCSEILMTCVGLDRYKKSWDGWVGIICHGDALQDELLQ